MDLTTKSSVVLSLLVAISALSGPYSATAQNPSSQQPGTSRSEADVTSDLAQQLIPKVPDVVRDAPENRKEGNSVFRLQAYIYRDFMPFATSGDAAGLAARQRHYGMIAIISLTDEHGMPVPVTWHADTIWIVQGASVWETSAIEERRSETGCDFVIRSGPKWHPRSSVDVIMRLKDGYGRYFYLAIRNQTIGAVS
jgi:S-formylglutathione hydrolase FrmB